MAEPAGAAPCPSRLTQGTTGRVSHSFPALGGASLQLICILLVHIHLVVWIHLLVQIHAQLLLPGWWWLLLRLLGSGADGRRHDVRRHMLIVVRKRSLSQGRGKQATSVVLRSRNRRMHVSLVVRKCSLSQGQSMQASNQFLIRGFSATVPVLWAVRKRSLSQRSGASKQAARSPCCSTIRY